MPAKRDKPCPSRILYVDSDRDYAQLMRWAAGHFGHDVTVCHDPASALSSLNSFPGAWAAVIADLGEPGDGGLEVADAVRARHPDLRCTVVARNASDDLARIVTSHGLAAPVRKPASMQQFARLVEHAIH